MNVSKKLHNLLSDGLQTDLNNLLMKFIASESVRYEEFSKIWREFNFPLIFCGLKSNTYQRRFTLDAYTITSKYLLPPMDLQTRICGMYMLYGLYYTQRHTPPLKIRVYPELWRAMRALFAEVKEHGHLDAAFIFIKMHNDKVFQFVFTQEPIVYTCYRTEDSYEKWKAERDLMNSTFKPDLLEQLHSLHNRYQEMKQDLGYHSNLSLALVRESMADYIVQRIHSHQPSDDEDDDSSVEANPAQERAARLAFLKQKSFETPGQMSQSQRHLKSASSDTEGSPTKGKRKARRGRRRKEKEAPPTELYKKKAWSIVPMGRLQEVQEKKETKGDGKHPKTKSESKKPSSASSDSTGSDRKSKRKKKKERKKKQKPKMRMLNAFQKSEEMGETDDQSASQNEESGQSGRKRKGVTFAEDEEHMTQKKKKKKKEKSEKKSVKAVPSTTESSTAASMSADEVGVAPSRGRGRPRKNPESSQGHDTDDESVLSVRRGLGRKKLQEERKGRTSAGGDVGTDELGASPRGRGRPRKTPLISRFTALQDASSRKKDLSSRSNASEEARPSQSKRGKMQNVVASSGNDDAPIEVNVRSPVGRPRKPLSEQGDTKPPKGVDKSEIPNVERRGRGRPRKHEQAAGTPQISSGGSGSESGSAKRKRGRPRKYIAEEEMSAPSPGGAGWGEEPTASGGSASSRKLRNGNKKTKSIFDE